MSRRASARLFEDVVAADDARVERWAVNLVREQLDSDNSLAEPRVAARGIPRIALVRARRAVVGDGGGVALGEPAHAVTCGAKKRAELEVSRHQGGLVLGSVSHCLSGQAHVATRSIHLLSILMLGASVE